MGLGSGHTRALVLLPGLYTPAPTEQGPSLDLQGTFDVIVDVLDTMVFLIAGKCLLL